MLSRGRVENNSNFAQHDTYSTTAIADDWLSQYGGQRDATMTRCQCATCYFARPPQPQASHKKCVPIYNVAQDDEHNAYQQTSYSWTQLG